jgi:hypothetical protein
MGRARPGPLVRQAAAAGLRWECPHRFVDSTHLVEVLPRSTAQSANADAISHHFSRRFPPPGSAVARPEAFGVQATLLNVRHPLSLKAVDSRVKPSLDGCPAVSNVSTDSVACCALTAVPSPVQGVNRHAEHLRQVGDRGE